MVSLLGPARLLIAEDAKEAEPEAPPGKRGLEEVIEEARRQYPEAVKVALDHKDLAARILRAGEEDAGKLARARLLAAELLEAAGEPAAARTLWVEVAREGPGAEDRAKAFYLLGLHYLLRERYKDAWKYWKVMPQVAPESPWTRKAGRYEPFLRMVDSGEVPDFRGRFGDVGEKGRDDFKGRWLLLNFWTAAGIGSRQEIQALRDAVRLARSQGWDGELLGINLDASRQPFEEAMAGWKVEGSEDHPRKDSGEPIIDWPQHHDGKGFQSPLARALGIPRAPMQILIDPEGRLRYAGSQAAALARALRGGGGD